MEKEQSDFRRLLKLWRPALIGLLLLIPIAVFIAAGGWALWQSDRWRWLLWATPLCWGIGYVLLRWWHRRLLPEWEPDRRSTRHWTPRDEAALEIVTSYSKRAGEVKPEQLVDPHFYLQTAMDLALRVAQHYHPKTKDPLSALTVLEILAAAQLALEDTADWIQKYVPGSTLLTLRQWRALARAPRWMKLAADATWALSLAFNPAALGRYVASRVAMDSASKQIQANVLEAFFGVYVHYVGKYLIEMNSGRLRGGARRYREVLARLNATAAATEVPVEPTSAGAAKAQETARETDVVTVALVGQVGAGKSSLIQAIATAASGATVRDEHRPASDSANGLPVHKLTLTHSGQQVHVLDTPGYSAADLTEAQRERIREAACWADIVLVVMKATSPARQADLRMIDETLAWFASQPRFKPPAMLGVLTHIDGLSPVMEWNPPYNWQQPIGPKETSIHEAVAYTQSLFEGKLRGVIPVCLAPEAESAYGVEQWLVPAMIALLGDARASALLRTLHTELDEGRARTVLSQLRNAGRGLLEVVAGMRR